MIDTPSIRNEKKKYQRYCQAIQWFHIFQRCRLNTNNSDIIRLALVFVELSGNFVSSVRFSTTVSTEFFIVWAFSFVLSLSISMNDISITEFHSANSWMPTPQVYMSFSHRKLRLPFEWDIYIFVLMKRQGKSFHSLCLYFGHWFWRRDSTHPNIVCNAAAIALTHLSTHISFKFYRMNQTREKNLSSISTIAFLFSFSNKWNISIVQSIYDAHLKIERKNSFNSHIILIIDQ